jgi:hypothetical protein
MCLAENCNNKGYSRGLCRKHYMAAYRLRKSGGVTFDPAIQTAVYARFDLKTCTECGASVHAKGLCGTHYARLLRSGKKQNARF